MSHEDAIEIEWRASGKEGASMQRVTLRPASDDGWHRSYSYALPVGPAARSVDLSIFLPRGEAWRLSPDRSFERLPGRSGCRPALSPLGAFLVTRGAGFWRWTLPCATLQETRLVGGRAVADMRIRCPAACGLTFWGAEKLRSPPPVEGVEVLADRLNDLSECLWIEPFPGGARGALCLTDHADFDSVEALRLLAPLVERTGFRFTKSVFPHGDPVPGRPDKMEPGLDDPAFRSEVARLHDLGVEIAYHGFSPRRDAPPLAECERRSEAMAAFSPETWIDHGTGDYLFSRQARLGGGADLVGLLDRLGIESYWSYFDVWDNPFGDLDSWRTSHPGRLAQEGLRLLGRSPAIPAGARRHAFRHVLGNLFGEHAYLDVRGRPASWRRAAGRIPRLWRLREAPQLLYGFDGRSPLTAKRWVFDTTLLNHLALQVGPGTLDRLAAGSALCLGHTYFGWSPQFGTNVFSRGENGSLRVLPAFEESLEHLGRLRKDRELIPLPFRDLRASLTAAREARLVRREHGWELQGASRTGVTVGLPSRFPAAMPGVAIVGGRRLLTLGAGQRLFLPLPGGASRC
jgi:hypothetical protein